MRELKTICVFLGSSTGSNPAISAATRDLGVAIAKQELRLVYGGGAVGLMGLLADAVLEEGGEVTGVIPRNLFGREVAHRTVTELIETDGMHQRKALMYELSDAFIALPGGLGTLDELAEVLTWRQIGLHDKPVGLVDVDGYFGSLETWLDRVVTDGLMNQNNRQLLISDPDPKIVLNLLHHQESAPSPKWDSA